MIGSSGARLRGRATVWCVSARGRRQLSRVVVAIILLAPIAGPAQRYAEAAPARRAITGGPALPATGAYWGAYVPLGTKYGSNRVLATQAFEAQVGRKQVLDREYYQWDAVWPQAWDYWARDQGHLLLISWGSFKADGTAAKWADIAGGV